MNTATATLSAARRTTPKQQIPIGLQIAARWVAGMTADTEHLRASLHAADGLAVRILHDPLSLRNDSDQVLSQGKNGGVMIGVSPSR